MDLKDAPPSGVAAWLDDAVQTGAAPAAAPPTVDRTATVEDMFDLAAAPVQAVVARLVSADGSSPTIDIMSDDTVKKLGRSKDLPVSTRLDVHRLSSHHCELRLDAATRNVSLVDTSTNGVWHNDVRLEKGKEMPLCSGDTVRLLNPAVKVAPGQPSLEYLFQQVKAAVTTDRLLEDLTCSVCKVLYYKPVTVIPCLHSFCAHCLSAWLDTASKDCPECRSKMREVRPSHKLSSMVDDLLKSKPALALSEEDRKQADADNKIPPLGMVLTKRSLDDVGYGGDDEDDDYDDSDDEGDSDSSSAPGGFLFAHAPAPVPFKLPMFFAAPPTSCAQCATASAVDGFMCPPHGPHLRCFLCKTAFPHRPMCEIPQQCDLCNKAFCDLYLGGCKNPGGVGYLQPVGDHQMKELPLGSLFLGNTIEQGILTRYITTAGVDVPTLWALCIEKLKNRTWIPDITSVKGPLADATVCFPCAQRVFSSLLYHFRRAIPRDSLPPAVTARSDCWYGIQCRTMKHNMAHCQAYNHVCPNVKRKE